MGTVSLSGVKSGRGVTLTPHPLLVPWSRKSRAIPLLPLCAVRPAQSLSACTRVHFTLLPPEIKPRVPDPEDQGMNQISTTEQTVQKRFFFFLNVRHEKRGKLISDSLLDSEEQACRTLRQRVIDTQTSGYGTPVALLRVRRRQSLRVVHSQRPSHVRFEVFRAA